jgi:biotin carboxylase
VPGRLVLLGSAQTYRRPPFEAAARALGIEVVMGEDVPQPFLGRAAAELPLDYRDLERSAAAIVRYAAEHEVGAIVGLDDSGTVLAARASAALGLPHNAPEAALRSRDKLAMRRCLAEAGVPQPSFRHAQAGDDPRALAAVVAYPCVLKPTTLAGSRGVMRADGPEELVSRFLRLRAILAAERCADVLVEGYVPGLEVALEGLLSGGALRVLALFDKPDPLEGPYFEETLYVTPSRLPAPVQEALGAAAARAAAALGLREGPVHAELRWSDGEAWLIEVAARSIGGLCGRTLRFGVDMSLEELILRHAFRLGGIEAPRESRAGGVMMIPIPAAGILRGVHGLEEARAVPLVESVEVTARMHCPLVPLPEGDSYLGFIFARGEGPAAVEAALREAHARLRFEIAAEVPLRRG